MPVSTIAEGSGTTSSGRIRATLYVWVVPFQDSTANGNIWTGFPLKVHVDGGVWAQITPMPPMGASRPDSSSVVKTEVQPEPSQVLIRVASRVAELINPS